jgi:hypothetical protein
MKEVVYQINNEKKVFLLTDEEFKVANASWVKDGAYWCDRLEVSLTKYYKWAETPKEDVGHEVYIDYSEGAIKKRYKRNGEYYSSITNLDGSTSKFQIGKVDDSKFIKQEDFYKKKFLLKW